MLNDDSAADFEIVLRSYFLDTSAIIKWVCEEPGSKKLAKLRDDLGAKFITSWVLLAEALGVLKRKWKVERTLSEQDYWRSVTMLFLLIRQDWLHPIDIAETRGGAQLMTYEFELLDLKRRYPDLDAADALQLKAIQGGFLKYLAGESRLHLVSADRKLMVAAEKEGIPVLCVCND